jgi:hypothetical protein
LLGGACHRAALSLSSGAHSRDPVTPTRWLAMTWFSNSSPRYRGIQEEVTMLEIFILAAGFAGGYAASVVSWPWVRARAIGAGAEINRLRARAKALEDSIKGAL